MRENDQNNSEYGHFLLRISPYSVRLGENADLNNCEYGHFLRSEWNFLTFWDSINWACNFKLSLNALSCFPELADKRKKIGNCFRNTSYQKRLSKVVKSIERWVMDALKWKKLQSFLCDDMAEIKSEISVISRRQIFDMKNSPCSSSKSGKKYIIYLDNHEQRFLSRLNFFSKPPLQLLILDMRLAEYNELPDFPVTGRITLRNWCKTHGSLSTRWCWYCAFNLQLY